MGKAPKFLSACSINSRYDIYNRTNDPTTITYAKHACSRDDISYKSYTFLGFFIFIDDVHLNKKSVKTHLQDHRQNIQNMEDLGIRS